MNVATDKKRIQVTLTIGEHKILLEHAKKGRRSISATIAMLALERLEQLKEVKE